MHKLYELKEKLMDELGDFSENGKYSKDDVEAIKYTASAIDHICNILERADDDYSMSGVRSYARRRDRIGRYSRGYSRAADGIVEDLRGLVAEAPDDTTRRELHSLIKRLESM